MEGPRWSDDSEDLKPRWENGDDTEKNSEGRHDLRNDSLWNTNHGSFVSPGRYSESELREHWRDWFRTKRDDVQYQRKIMGLWLGYCEDHGTAEMVDILEEMRDSIREAMRRYVQLIQAEVPIAFFRPSWEQAQIMNAWHPSFDPANAPNGYQSVVNLSSNRGGKTTADVVDTQAWLIPNDKDWVMFQPQEDEEGKRHGQDRGTYCVLPRPDWETWRRTGRMVYPWDSAPPKGPCEIWHGVENDSHWNDKVGKEYLKWLPKSEIARRPDGGMGIFKQERRIDFRTGSSVTGKTYNADQQDWAGKAVWRINMDEGFDKRIFDEASLRVQSGGQFHWAYTAAEARNTGQRAKLAWECYKGKHKLIGQAKFFTGFKMSFIPEWIMPADKKADDMERLSREGGMGRVRMGEIPFFESSPLVFNNFDRERNVLPIDGSDVLMAIKGEKVERWKADLGLIQAQRLQALLYRSNVVRGMDEGMAAPTACVWVAILPTGEYVAFRCWEEPGLSVSQRCEKIIDLSGNTRELVKWDEDEHRRTYKEKQTGMKVRRTFADSKMFRRNQEDPQDLWPLTYWRAGLKIERASTVGPAGRCDALNDMLRADPTRQHLIRASDPGSRWYATRDCTKLIERFENYLFEQYATGSRAGEFTGLAERKDDHVPDSAGYIALSKLRWHDVDDNGIQPQTWNRPRDPMTGYQPL